MEKLKIIQINSASSSFYLKDFRADIFKNWFGQVAFQIKKASPNIEVEAWTLEKEEKRQRTAEKNGVKFRIFPTNLSIRHGMELSLSMLRALKQEIRKAGKEKKKLILHFHEYHSWQVYWMLLNSRKIRKIAQHHGARSPFKNLMRYKRLFLFFPIIGLMQLCENLLLKRINIFYALSDDEALYLREKFGRKRMVRFQTMGIENDCFKKGDKKKARRKLGLEQKKKYVLYIGRLKTTKGVRELLDAVKIVDKEVELLIMGNGQDNEKYRRYAKQKKIENVKFLGEVYGKEKLLYLDASDCLILPSYTEGAPVVLMEALAKNLPVIATDVGGIRKMIQNGREGLIIRTKSRADIIQAIRKILTWKKNVKLYASRYKWEKIIKHTIADYERLLR